ncbi:MAG: NAD-dependent epimerase/dehydratase family protein, partial [Armatimonadota bacterium]
SSAQAELPALIESVEQLGDVLSQPTPEAVSALAKLEGDLLILGVGGKIGPSLAKMARRALNEAGASDRRVIGVDLFPTPEARDDLEAAGIEPVTCELLDPGALAALPDAPNIIFMAGRKFGSSGAEWLTWALNSFLPGLVAQRYPNARIVAFSTGNVYPLVPIGAGSVESDAPDPIGEYAQSCLGRERMFQHFSHENGTPVLLFRLNYACELRYGTLLDVAQKVHARQPIDLTMGHFNTIWQGDANAVALRCLDVCASPPEILNVTGPELLSVRRAAEQFAELLETEPVFVGEEAETALLSDAARCNQLFGSPRVSVRQLMEWIAHWVKIDGPTLGKPTHFEEREGKF